MLSSASPKPKKVKVYFQLPPWYDRDLLLWAYAKGTSKAALAGNIIQARIEANRADVEATLLGIAESMEISVEDLKRQILADAEKTSVTLAENASK